MSYRLLQTGIATIFRAGCEPKFWHASGWHGSAPDVFKITWRTEWSSRTDEDDKWALKTIKGR
jgi:hypothetical protein